jgi:hypothetical protein
MSVAGSDQQGIPLMVVGYAWAITSAEKSRISPR